MKPFRRILLPIELSEVSESAVDLALGLASQSGAEVIVFTAFEPPTYVYPSVAVDALSVALETAEDLATKGVETLAAKLRERYPRIRGVAERGFAREEILEAIPRLDCDLVVMATHGRRGVARAVLGSTAEVVVRKAEVPVLTVHPDARKAA